MLPGVVDSRGYNPQEIVRQVHKSRISVIVSGPRILELCAKHVVSPLSDTMNEPSLRNAPEETDGVEVQPPVHSL